MSIGRSAYSRVVMLACGAAKVQYHEGALLSGYQGVQCYNVVQALCLWGGQKTNKRYCPPHGAAQASPVFVRPHTQAGVLQR